MKCLGTNAQGEPCVGPEHMVDEAGYCPAHRPGGLEHMREIAAKGGDALKRKHDGGGFALEELARMTTLEDAKTALDDIRVAILTRRITHNEGASALRAVGEWVKAEASAQTQRIVNELRTELESRTEEIAELRRQLAGRAGNMRVAR